MLEQKDSYDNLCGCFVYEPWFEPKDDESLKQEWNLPYLCLIGDRWKKMDTLWNTCTMVYDANKHKHNKHFVHLEGFTHQDFCDASMFGPQWLLKKADSCCKNDTNQNAQDIFVKQCVEFVGDVIPEWRSGIDTKYLQHNQTNVHVETPELRESK